MTDTWEDLWGNPLYKDWKPYPPGGDLIVGRNWFRKMRAVGDLLLEKANKYDDLKELLTTDPQMDYDDVQALRYEVNKILERKP